MISFSDRNELAANRRFESIESGLVRAAEHPQLFKPGTRIPGLREFVAHPNYVVFYRITPTCIEVVNVVHARREFP